jgi:hypothetical protein
VYVCCLSCGVSVFTGLLSAENITSMGTNCTAKEVPAVGFC